MTIQLDSLPRIALAELQRAGYTEDRSTRSSFHHHYPLIVVFGILCCAVSVFLLLFARSHLAAWSGGLGYVYMGAFFLCGLVMAVGAATSPARGTAYSLRSGQQMFRFRRSDPAEGDDEIIYVDQESRTFFCQVVPQRQPAEVAS